MYICIYRPNRRNIRPNNSSGELASGASHCRNSESLAPRWRPDARCVRSCRGARLSGGHVSLVAPTDSSSAVRDTCTSEVGLTPRVEGEHAQQRPLAGEIGVGYVLRVGLTLDGGADRLYQRRA